MVEPMPDARLAEIRSEAETDLWRGSAKAAARDVLELLAEVERVRTLEFTTLPDDAFTPEQVAKWPLSDRLARLGMQLLYEQKQAMAEAASAQIEQLRESGVISYDLPQPPPSGPLWQPFRDQPRSHDYPTGG